MLETKKQELTDERRAYLSKWQKENRSTNNEITLPECITPELRDEFKTDLEAFFRKGFPDLFSDPFGTVQKDSIRYEQRKLMEGGRDLNKLEPRGFGKSSRGLLARVWAVLCGYKELCIVCSSSTTKAAQLMRMVSNAVSQNQILLGCWPELWAFHALQGNPQKPLYQTYNGEKTDIKLRTQEIQFPDLGPEYPSSRSVIFIVPFEKSRGVNLEGKRPDDVLLDDVQSTKDALSPSAPAKLEQFLNSDIAFLGSRKNPVSITNNATIIAPDDFPDRLTRNTGFKTIRYKMVEEFPNGPESAKLWEKYFEIRGAFSEIGDDDLRALSDSLDFYKKNREAMDLGSRVTWDHAYSHKPEDCEISTIQAAYNFIHKWGQDAFDSECQNSPPRQVFESDELTKQHILSKQHGQPRGVVPIEAEKLVCDIDVQGESIWSTVAAGSQSFESFIVDLEVFPKQKTIYPSKSKLTRKLKDEFKGADKDSRIYQGVKAVLGDMLSRQYKHGDGNKGFDAIAVDVKWNDKIVRRAIRDMNDSRIYAYNGHGISATKAPMSAWKQGAGEKKGMHWHIRAARGQVRNFVSDVNFWKSFVQKHFLIPIGQAASLSVFNTEDKRELETFARHIKSEVGKVSTDDVSGRKVETWSLLPGLDNEWLDTTAGAMALLSFCGCECLGAEMDKKTIKRKANTQYF